jgi:hypothetical protein
LIVVRVGQCRDGATDRGDVRAGTTARGLGRVELRESRPFAGILRGIVSQLADRTGGVALAKRTHELSHGFTYPVLTLGNRTFWSVRGDRTRIVAAERGAGDRNRDARGQRPAAECYDPKSYHVFLVSLAACLGRRM